MAELVRAARGSGFLCATGSLPAREVPHTGEQVTRGTRLYLG
jgi:hypothetical protein